MKVSDFGLRCEISVIISLIKCAKYLNGMVKISVGDVVKNTGFLLQIYEDLPQLSDLKLF